MESERWAELKAAFAALVDLAPGERERRLAAMVSRDPELSRRLEELLAADESPEPLLGPLPPLPGTPAESEPESAAEAGDASQSDPFGLTGRTVSHFRVQSVLGVGGVGVLYRAQDVRLNRTVALKFLLPQYTLDTSAKERFLREAHAVSGLDHANICTIYEVGETDDGRLFLAMKCYDGETLKERIASRGALPLPEALEIARQVLKGVGAAHAAGIVHRDLKPGNLMLTANGTVKILDFGLAKVRDLKLTEPDLRPGTVAYMSPEQIDGGAVDHRTDLWSVGVVLYEMLTGETPFGRGHDLATVYSILNDPAPRVSDLRPETPPSIERIVEKLLAKRYEERYSSATDVLAELESSSGPPWQTASGRAAVAAPRRRKAAWALAAIVTVGGALAATLGLRGPPSMSAPPGEPGPPAGRDGTPSPRVEEASVAVLPFLDLSPSADQAYLSDGMTEELIGQLSRVEGLKVPARTSSFQFRDGRTDVREIGRRLGVEHVIEGSVRRAGDRLRVTVQLVSTANGYEIWSETYDRPIDDVLAVQDEIGKAIVASLPLQLSGSGGSDVGQAPIADVEAYELYLRGRFFANRRTDEALDMAAEYYRQAIAIDPGFARAHAGLAETFIATRQSAPRERFERGREAALAALAIDSTLAEAHTAMGWIEMWYDRDWAAADRHFQRALASNPNYLWAHQWYSAYLSAVGRLEEALTSIRTAHRIDPLSVTTITHIGSTLFWLRRYDEALAEYGKALELDPDFFMAHWGRSRALLQMGRYREATEALEPRGTDYVGFFRLGLLGHAHAAAGRESEARRVLDDLEARAREGTYVAPTEFAAIYIGLGDFERALDWLERHEADRGARIFLRVDPMFDPLRSDPRFVRLLQRLGLVARASS